LKEIESKKVLVGGSKLSKVGVDLSFIFLREIKIKFILLLGVTLTNSFDLQDVVVVNLDLIFYVIKTSHVFPSG